MLSAKNYPTGKKIYYKRWLAIKNGKRILLEYCQGPSYLITKEEREMVIKLFKQAEECGTPIDDAADNLENYFLS